VRFLLSLPILGALVAASAPQAASIRNIDFANFVFTLDPCDVSPEQVCTVRLVDGERLPSSDQAQRDPWIRDQLWVHLDFVHYGDVTGDGQDDAVVRFGWNAGGTGQFSQLLVYGLVSGEPAILATFPTGDRAQGGYLDACIRDHVLIIVRERGTAAACADYLENTSYSWHDDHF